jgi:hypothetical protein
MAPIGYIAVIKVILFFETTLQHRYFSPTHQPQW